MICTKHIEKYCVVSPYNNYNCYEGILRSRVNKMSFWL